MKEIIVAKLRGGEFLIGKKQGNLIERPLNIFFDRNGIGFSDIFVRLFKNAKDIKINLDETLYYAEASEKLAEKYIELTSNIVVSKNKIINLEEIKK